MNFNDFNKVKVQKHLYGSYWKRDKPLRKLRSSFSVFFEIDGRIGSEDFFWLSAKKLRRIIKKKLKKDSRVTEIMISRQSPGEKKTTYFKRKAK